MTVSTLDPITALVVVDLQNSVARIPIGPHSTEEVVANSRLLLDAFRAKGLPVVLVNVDGRAPGRNETTATATAAATAPAAPPAPDATDFVPGLDQQPTDHVVTKQTWGAFTGTDLESFLRGRGATQVVVTGIATTAGVESTARQAHEAGFHVTLATDAMSDMSADAHANSVTRIFPRLGETGTTAEILALLP